MSEVVFFNNCRNRPHEKIYRRGAFFDLYEHQRRPVRYELQPGQICVTASYTEHRDVRFEWWRFKKECVMKDEYGDDADVTFGVKQFVETLPKLKANTSKRNGKFFDKNGNFKRPSMTVGQISEKSLPVRT